MILIGFALMPFVWIGGVLVGHRFNGGWLATLPFVANLVVMSCIAKVLYSFMRAEHNDWDAEFLYVAGLIAILGFGLSSAIGAAWRSKPPQCGNDSMTPQHLPSHNFNLESAVDE